MVSAPVRFVFPGLPALDPPIPPPWLEGPLPLQVARVSLLSPSPGFVLGLGWCPRDLLETRRMSTFWRDVELDVKRSADRNQAGPQECSGSDPRFRPAAGVPDS